MILLATPWPGNEGWGELNEGGGGRREGGMEGKEEEEEKGTGFVDAWVSPSLFFIICFVFFVFLNFWLISINQGINPPPLFFILLHLPRMEMAVLMHL